MKELDPDADRRLVVIECRDVSEEKRTHAGYSAPERNRLSGRLAIRRMRKTPWTIPWGFRKTGRSAGHWPFAMRPACTMPTNISVRDAIGSLPQSTPALFLDGSEVVARCFMHFSLRGPCWAHHGTVTGNNGRISGVRSATAPM